MDTALIHTFSPSFKVSIRESTKQNFTFEKGWCYVSLHFARGKLNIETTLPRYFFLRTELNLDLLNVLAESKECLKNVYADLLKKYPEEYDGFSSLFRKVEQQSFEDRKISLLHACMLLYAMKREKDWYIE